MTTSSPRTPAGSSAGFTLIELLIVVVVLGILASVAIPKYQLMRERASKGSVTADLRNLAVAQESHFLQKHKYSADVDSLQFRTTSGVVVTIIEATDKGWSATGKRPGISADECAIYYGSAAPLSAARNAGMVQCQ